MSSAAHIVRAARPALRFNPTSKFSPKTLSSSSARFSSSSSAASSLRAQASIRHAWQRTMMQGKRFQSTEAAAAGTGATAAGATGAGVQQSWVQRMWDSPIGLKTWALVIAGISDLARPAEKLSLTQNAALTATGIIWTRWCLIIKPRNILLATVNFFLGMVGVVQVSRILLWRQSEKNKSALEQVEDKAIEAKDKIVNAAKA
ncbi:UPF0041 domain protein [Rutstroemia sp. NJR-2017a WRK4]|nr:UPF0041 domain protein [Rutstroemia sp. NJR-2017a WRK4]